MRAVRTGFAAALGTSALVLLGSAQPGAAQDGGACKGEPSAVRFYVDVENVRSSRGLIAVTVYADDSRRFLARGGALDVGRVPAAAPVTPVCVYLPSAGVYAFAVYHDEDGNRRFNRNRIGLPAEAYGFSNNPRTLFSLPSFRSVRFSVPRSGLRTRVRLRYP